MADRVFYEVDPFNRLIIRPGTKRSRVKKFRQVVTGRFIADSGNNLLYEVNKSSGIDVPQKIKFSGRYSLDKNHNLILTLDKWNNQCEGNRFTLKTKIIDAKSNEIALSVNSKVNENRSLTYLMKLYGSWQADKNNRLTFGVERDGRQIDNLTLYGGWEINKYNEIIYKHGRNNQVITFRGYWDIAARHRISYILDKKSNSGFNFRSSLGTLAPKGKDTYVTFDIGIRISGAKKLRRKVIFSGRWKIDKNRELTLETSDIEEGEVALRFTKEMFDRSAMAYIESIYRENERFIGGGITFRW